MISRDEWDYIAYRAGLSLFEKRQDPALVGKVADRLTPLWWQLTNDQMEAFKSKVAGAWNRHYNELVGSGPALKF